jgi:hypothetical protein
MPSDRICWIRRSSNLGSAPAKPSFKHPGPKSAWLKLSFLVSDCLDSLAGQRPLISEGLIITISGNVRHTAALLEVPVAAKMGLVSEPGPADA